MEFITHTIILKNGERINIRQLKDQSGRSVCPVCGFIGSSDLPWGMARSVNEETGEEYGEAIGGASFDICPCCRVQYGLDDMFSSDRNPTMLQIWDRLRIKWLDRVGWTPEALKQLQDNLDINTKELKLQAGKE